MKNLVVYPTDFSDCAENALSFAVALTKALDCTLRTVHNADFTDVLTIEENPQNAFEKINDLEKEIVALLNEVKEKAERQAVKCEYEIVRRKVSWLDDYLNELQPRMAVMGTTGASGFQNKLMGSPYL